MLQAQTILIVAIIADALFCACGLILYRAQRQIPGMLPLAASFGARSAGFLLLLLASPEAPSAGTFVATWLGNALAASSMVLMLEGFARFLERPRMNAVEVAILATVVLGWPVLMLLWPDGIVIRISLFSLLIGLCYGACASMFLRDRRQPASLRYIMTGWCCLIVLAALCRAAGAFLLPPESLVGTNAYQEIYLLIHLLSFLFMGLMTAILVGVRLRAELLSYVEDERSKLLMLSHELRTPLATIARASEMLETLNRQTEPALARRVVHIRQATDRMNRLVEAFLSSGLAAPGGEHNSAFDLAKLIRQLAAAPRFVFDMPQRLDFDGDRDSIAIIVSNLLDNALKYAPDDSPIKLVLTKHEGSVTLKVSDRGIGPGAPAEREQLGSRFFRAGNTKGYDGTGLGLFTAKRLAARYDGDISISPRNGGGTEVTLTLHEVHRDT